MDLICVCAACLPIFNRGKRPRQALLTHPNNVDAGLEQQGGHWNNTSQYFGKPQQGHGQSRSPSIIIHVACIIAHVLCIIQLRYIGLTHTHSYSSYPTNQPKPVTTNTPAPHNMPARTSGYNRSQSNKENLHTTTSFRPFRGNRDIDAPAPGASRHPNNHNIPNATCNNRGLSFTPHNSSSNHPNRRPPTHSNTVRSFSPSPSPSASPAPGRAVEPTKQQVRVIHY